METLLILMKTPFMLLFLMLRAIKWIAEHVMGGLIKGVLTQSQQAYLDRRKWQRHWLPLAEGLQYMPVMASVLTNDPKPISRIYVQNIGDEVVEQLDLYVVARNGKLKYSETANLFNLAPGDVEAVELSRIPLEDIHVRKDGIYLSYESYGVFPLQVVWGGKTQRFKPGIPSWSPMYNDFLHSCWWRFKGYLYNTDAIEDYKTAFQHWLAYHLVTRFGIFWVIPNEQLRVILHQRQYGLLPNVGLYWLLSQSWVLTAICWTSLILGAHKLRFVPPDIGTETN